MECKLYIPQILLRTSKLHSVCHRCLSISPQLFELNEAFLGRASFNAVDKSDVIESLAVAKMDPAEVSIRSG